MEKEKETLNDELNNCKAKLLKYDEEKKQWEKERVSLAKNIKKLKQKHAELEKEVNEKEREPQVQIIPPPAHASA